MVRYGGCGDVAMREGTVGARHTIAKGHGGPMNESSLLVADTGE